MGSVVEVRRVTDKAGRVYVSVDDLKTLLSNEAFNANDVLLGAQTNTERAAALGIREGLTICLQHLDRIAEHVVTED